MKLTNEVHITGFVCTEPQQSGRGPYRFRLSHGGGKKKDGTEWPTQFFSVIVWDTAQVPKKGDRVELFGKLHMSEFRDKAGNDRTSIEIVAESILVEEHPLTPDVNRRGTEASNEPF
jgi:single-stranded DNA-binding protein